MIGVSHFSGTFGPSLENGGHAMAGCVLVKCNSHANLVGHGGDCAPAKAIILRVAGKQL
jgi:hypothetical protein